MNTSKKELENEPIAVMSFFSPYQEAGVKNRSDVSRVFVLFCFVLPCHEACELLISQLGVEPSTYSRHSSVVEY